MMNAPIVEIRPIRPAACSEAATTLDVLLRIHPPASETPKGPRPPINLGIVLDRSGSMAREKKMTHAREAAGFAITHLLPTDLVSVTIYDEAVETIVPTCHPTDKASLLRRLHTIVPRGSTALFDGWRAGANQVAGALVAGGLNRVILLSDGLANVGQTDPAAIVSAVKAAASGQVVTSTLGVGSDYNEDLMEAIARAGEGNYYFVENPVQLTDIFQTELHDLMSLAATRVSLGITPGEGVAVADVLNDFDLLGSGRLMLPNLVAGLSIGIVIRFHVEPRAESIQVASFRLAWDRPDSTERLVTHVVLDLPSIPKAAWDALSNDPDVHEQATLLLSARARIEAARALERGDVSASRALLGDSYSMTSSLPDSVEKGADLAAIERLVADLDSGDRAQFAKRSKQQFYARRHGKDLT